MDFRFFSLVTMGGLLLATSSASQAEVTANAAVSSNYYWRGITQTNDATAVSGGIDYSNDNGFYAGTWVSNVDFGNQTSYELDLYAGFSQSFDDYGYDLGYIYYSYPDALGSSDFGELYASMNWQWLETKVSYLSHAQSDASTEEDMLYLELNASFSILNDTELSFHLGQSRGDTVKEWFNEDTYIDYGVSIAKQGFTLGLTKTNLADDDVNAYISYAIDLAL